MSNVPGPPLTPIQEAEQARQVVNVLTRLESRYVDGRWIRGYRVGPDGGNCLIGAIDEATRWVLPGVAEQVTAELVARLPAPFRALGRVRPRLALASYNDTVGGRDGALDLVRRTRAELGGLPLEATGDVPAARPWTARQPTSATEGAAEEPEPVRIIDVTDRWVAHQPLQR